MPVEQLPLFVFGTLRRGQCNHHYLAGSYVRMLPARLPGFGKIDPLMIVRRSEDVVVGELYDVRPDAWTRTIAGCDALEGIPPGRSAGPSYRRVRVRVTTSEGEHEAWAYAHAGTSESE
jgi:gamma-glutamylcyclotransferase (GGCT)/AIG2-like uncharacterized protein YtfP